MALINQNSIIGVTSITSPSASNVLTFHTNDTTERLRVTPSGVSFSGTNASLDTSGNLTIAGVLTYEDVTSVDSVGIVTAQSGINVTGGVTVGTGATLDGSTNTIIASTNGSERLRIDSNGLLRHGVISGGTYNGNISFAYNDRYPSIEYRTGGTIDGRVWKDVNSGYFLLENVTNGFIFEASNSEALRINSSGNVGIGTDNPQAKLDVAGEIRASGIAITANSPGILFQDANSGSTESKIEGLSGHLYYTTDNANRDHIFSATGESEALRITGDGNVGIGSDNPQAKLDVAGEIRASGIAITTSYPTIKPSLNLNFAGSRSLDSRITFTRASVGTYVGRDGLIKTAGEDEARFDHEPVTLESLGLLIEESSTNYCGNSEMLANWSLPISDTFTASSGAQLSANPDGSSPAYHYVPSTTSGLHRYNRAVTLPTLDTDYVVSLFVKRVTAGSVSNLNRYVELETTGSWAANSPGTGHSGANGGTAVTFDLQDLAIQSKTDNTDGYTGGAKIEDYGNGWYRLSYVFNPGIGSQFTGQVWWGHPTTLGGDSNVSGNGNPSFYFWGASVENGKFITSHIPTPANSSVTRAKDVATILEDSFDSFYNPNEWTVDFVYRIRSVEQNGSNYRIWDINNNSNDGRLGALYSPNSTMAYFGYENGGTSFSSDDVGYPVVVNQEYHGALAYSPTSTIAFLPGAGTLGSEDTTVALDGPTQLQIGDWYADDRTMNGTIAKLVYYPKRLSNAELLALTSNV